MDIDNLINIGIEKGLITKTEKKFIYSHINKSYDTDPEEYVRAATYVYLIDTLEYPVNRIDLEVIPLQRNPQNPSDIIVYSDDQLNARFIVVENKANSTLEDIEQAKRQGLGNANLQGAQFLYLVCGSEEIVYDVTEHPSLRNLEDYRIADIPKSYGKAPVYRFIKGGDQNFDLRTLNLNDLSNKFERSHKAIWDGGKRDPVTAFDQMSKIMFAKIYDEMQTSQGSPYRCQVGTGEGVSIVASRVRQVYDEAVRNQPSMFSSEIDISDEILVEVIGNIQEASLDKSDIDAKGRAFEQFIGKYFRGEYGQYFTPRNVVSSIVDIANIFKPLNNTNKVIDPACGSGGFLLQVFSNVKTLIQNQHKGDSRTTQRLQIDFARDRLFGIEINEKIARVAMMDMVIHEDGSSNIKCDDALEKLIHIDPQDKIAKESFDFVFTNPPFGNKVDSRSDYYNDYYLGGAGSIAHGNTQQIEILFIERCLDLLKEDGLLSIVLPDSAITNIENILVCDFILSKSFYLGALSLPQHTFNPFGSNAKTTVLFLKKSKNAQLFFDKRQEYLKRIEVIFEDDSLTPSQKNTANNKIRTEYKDIDYPILLTHIEKVGHDAVGKPDDNLLPDAIEIFKQYWADKQNFESSIANEQLWFSKVYFLDLITKLDVDAYSPAYFSAMEELLSMTKGELHHLSKLCLDPPVQSGTGSSTYLDEGVPIIKTADVVKRRRASKKTKVSAAKVGFINWDEISDCVSPTTWDKQNFKKLQLNDILVQCVAHSAAYIGDKITIIDILPEDGKALALNKFLIIRPNQEEVSPSYLVQFLASRYGRLQMARYNRGMTAQIYEQDVKEFIIYVPPKSAQNRLETEFKLLVKEVRELDNMYIEILDKLDDFNISEE
jgi:type I restriction enzyme M protein